MSTKLIDLKDRIITDKGEVVAKYELLVQKALSGEVFTDFLALPHDDIRAYNGKSGHARPITIWEDSGGAIEGPDEDTFEWTIPKKYLDLNIMDICAAALMSRGLVTEEYVQRLAWELDQMDQKDMFPFMRCLLYVTDKFHEKGVVWGVGRGSSCASLVLFLLRINRVDPVKYGIPPEEFFK